MLQDNLDIAESAADVASNKVTSLWQLFDPALFDVMDMWDLLIRFAFNAIIVTCIIHLLYYPKSRRRDYYFTFSLISVSIFFLIYLLGGVKLKVGFALGLFAIFGIIRYRTESMPVREMTYLFVIIAISVINALAAHLLQALVANVLFVGWIWLCESTKWLKHVACKLVLYDRVELTAPDRRQELIDDLQKRTGLTILRLEVGHIDFLRDTAMLKVYYEPESHSVNTVDNVLKFPKEGQ
jgi:predicted DNA-binding transcriptional regulator